MRSGTKLSQFLRVFPPTSAAMEFKCCYFYESYVCFISVD